MVTLETADNALKSFYLDAVTESLNFKANPFFAQLEHSTADVVGKDVKKLVRLGINGGIMAGTETGELPTATERDSVVLTSSLKNLYGTIEISDKAMRASANSDGAFVNLLNDEMQSLVKSASLNFSRMLFGDGTGFLGKVTYAKGHVIKVDDAAQFLEGMVVDFLDSTKTPIGSLQAVKVQSVTRETKSLTFAKENMESVVSAGGYIVLHGCRDKEMTGLKAIFGDGDLYGVARTSCMYVNPHKNEDAGDITESVVQTMIDNIELDGGGKVNFIVCSHGVKRALVEYYRTLSVALPTMELKGGYKALSFNGIPVVADRFCPKGTMYLLNTDDFKIHQLCDWKWLEGEDGKILKQIPGKPVYTATLVKYAELVCERPCGQGVITGITEA